MPGATPEAAARPAITNMNPSDTAIERFKQEYSCTQSVFSALAERWEMDPEISLRVSAGFGGGIARTARTCGCVTGAVMAIGMAQTNVRPEENRAARERTYELCRRLLSAFEQRHGSTMCSELLGCDISTPEGMSQAREQSLFRQKCAQFVRDAVEITDSLLPRAS